MNFMQFRKIFFGLLLASSLCHSALCAAHSRAHSYPHPHPHPHHSVSHTTEATMDAFINAYLPVGYQQVSQRAVTIDGAPAKLVRYQPTEQSGQRKTQLGSAHFSVITGADGGLKGFVWLAPQLAGGGLPSKKNAQSVAEAFLQRYAPDLHAHKEMHWVAPHDETIRADGKSVTLTGMKVKMRDTRDGRWFWVIVGNQGKPMVFERDIVWISFPGKRQTEKWLHDAWLGQQQ